MGIIQGAINQAIGTAGAGVTAIKGVKALEGKTAKTEAEQVIETGKTQERIANIESELNQGAETRKQTREKIKEEQKGFTLVDGVKVRTSFLGEEAVKEQNELIEKYKMANRESLKVDKAKRVQLAGLKMKLDLLGGKK